MKAFLLKQYQLGSREYRARFLHASRNTGETWVSFASRLANMFRYYTNSRDCHDFDTLFDLCVADKLRDSLPHGNLKHCLAVEKDKCLSSQELANIADQYESNFFPDGRYKGLSITAGQSGARWKQANDHKSPVAEQAVPAHQTEDATMNVFAGKGNVPNNKSPSTKPKLFGTPLTTRNPVKCWKRGELGHTATAHSDPSSAHYSEDRPPSKPMLVNACIAQDSGPGASAEIAPALDAVQIGHCAVDHRTESGGLGVNSPEGPLFNLLGLVLV